VVAVDLLALAGFALVFPYHAPGYIVGLSLLASLAVMTGTGPVRIPSLKTSVSVTDAFVFTALGAFGPMPACIVAAAGVLGSTLGKERHRKPIHFMFNLGNVVGTTAAASAVYMAAGATPGGPILTQIWPLFGATSVYVIINTVMVSLAVVVDSRQSFLATWSESLRWSAVSAYAGLTMSAFLLWAIALFGPQGLALGVPPLWLLAAFYRTHKERQLEAQQRVNTVEIANAELEDKVAERTQELQQALSRINRVNDELRSTNARLVESDRAKSEFLANVSHELRTPLNAIIGFSDLLQDRNYGTLNHDQGDFVRDINESGEHLLRLINDILDVTKIEAGKMEANIETLDVVRSIQDTVSMVRPQAGSKELKLTVDCGPEPLAAKLDAGMFRQLLLNLLSNAVKFTPEGGRVEVLARGEQSDLVIEVADTGIGIPREDLERVFDEFYQVDASYSRNYEGTGLGLALVRRMVRLLDGEISAVSEVGSGSRFTCRFLGSITEWSAINEATETVESVQPADSVREQRVAPSDGRTIMVVEDNPVNRKLARNALASQGYVVHEATTGEEALVLLEHQVADLILMDIQLPGMDGLEVTRRLKADPRTAGIPIVALTAHVKEADEAKAREAGCAGYITKPIRLAHFPAQVASYIPSEALVAGS
jgi:signal transduction histidine kinase/CheY-like chemotaxis protein